MFGLLIAAEFIHRPALDRQSRGVIGQLVTLVILNLILGFTVLGNVDNWAHIGGLVTGLWLGVLLAPDAGPDAALDVGPPGSDAGHDRPGVRRRRDEGDPDRRPRRPGRVLRPALDARRRPPGPEPAVYDPGRCSRCCPVPGRASSRTGPGRGPRRPEADAAVERLVAELDRGPGGGRDRARSATATSAGPTPAPRSSRPSPAATRAARAPRPRVARDRRPDRPSRSPRPSRARGRSPSGTSAAGASRAAVDGPSPWSSRRARRRPRRARRGRLPGRGRRRARGRHRRRGRLLRAAFLRDATAACSTTPPGCTRCSRSPAAPPTWRARAVLRGALRLAPVRPHRRPRQLVPRPRGPGRPGDRVRGAHRRPDSAADHGATRRRSSRGRRTTRAASNGRGLSAWGSRTRRAWPRSTAAAPRPLAALGRAAKLAALPPREGRRACGMDPRVESPQAAASGTRAHRAKRHPKPGCSRLRDPATIGVPRFPRTTRPRVADPAGRRGKEVALVAELHVALEVNGETTGGRRRATPAPRPGAARGPGPDRHPRRAATPASAARAPSTSTATP